MDLDVIKTIDNVNTTLASDLKESITPNSKLQIAAACFSIYAYQELKSQLEDISELQFIFTSPTFTTEKAKKSKREFYIPKLSREKGLYGTEFEIKLRNEMSQKAIAKECAEWIKNKVTFKSNITDKVMGGISNAVSESCSPQIMSDVYLKEIEGKIVIVLEISSGNYTPYYIKKRRNPKRRLYSHWGNHKAG